MSLFSGIAFLAVSLLLLRVFKVWDEKYGPMGQRATMLMVNFALPLTSAGLMYGAVASVISLWVGVTWQDVAAAAATAAIFMLAWRRLGALPGRAKVVPFTPRPGYSDAPSGIAASPRKKAA